MPVANHGGSESLQVWLIQNIIKFGLKFIVLIAIRDSKMFLSTGIRPRGKGQR